MLSEEGLRTLRNHVGSAFEAGTSTFPHYTLHGLPHLEEVDRLARLLGERLNLEPERLALLRLAVILHDFAMVRVPDPAREAELRQQMDPALSFADVVRKTHQDEIVEIFSKDDWLSQIHGALPGITPHSLDDAITIARHHRFHPLAEAPAHLRDLCALMRLADELDIGDRRAPLPAYQALRLRMDEVSRFHWLKHHLTRPVREPDTLVVELRGKRRVLRLVVAVKAPEAAWRALEAEVLAKLRHVLEEEGVNYVLAESLAAQVEVVSGETVGLSGASGSVQPIVRADLSALSAVGLLRSQPPAPAPSPEPVVGRETVPARRRRRELKILAVPPEALADKLCLSGRLTVIRNTYIRRSEEHVAGKAGADSRLYVGPADCGKTRAASEWVADLTDGRASQWVVLRTDMGTIPEDVEDIVLDTSAYEAEGYQLPQKAILFLDDLPTHLPPPSQEASPLDAVRRLFRWYQRLPYFREHRLVGTIRAEDMRSVEDWPEGVADLGYEVELLRLQPLEPEEYQALWRGMSTGAVAPSLQRGIEGFDLQVTESFLAQVSEKQADPEAVATFVQQAVGKGRESLDEDAAQRFSTSAVETWLQETWPAVREAYGASARVFYSLARFLEAGLRGNSPVSLFPAWGFHEIFGPDLCRQVFKTDVTDYLRVITGLLSDGHAAGRPEAWIRPRFDFVLQAEALPGVDVELPPVDWFVRRASQLTPKGREAFADFLSVGGVDLDIGPAEADAHWHFGWGLGTSRRIDDAEGEEKTRILYQAISAYRCATRADPTLSYAWYNLGHTLQRAAQRVEEQDRRVELLEEELAAYRRATEVNPQFAPAWIRIGHALTEAAQRVDKQERQVELLEEGLAALRLATELEPQFPTDAQFAWYNLGVARRQLAERVEEDRRVELYEEAIAALRRATEADPQFFLAWYDLGLALERFAERVAGEDRRVELHEEAIAAFRRATEAIASFRRATEAAPQLALAWFNLGVVLWQSAKRAEEESRRVERLEEASSAFRRAAEEDPKDAATWYNLGIVLWQSAERAEEECRRVERLEEASSAFRRATEEDPKDAAAWANLGITLGEAAEGVEDEDRRGEALKQEVVAYRRAAEADPQDAVSWSNLAVALARTALRGSESQPDRYFKEALVACDRAIDLGADRYNRACILALMGEHTKALDELRGCLEREEIPIEHVREDPDWEDLRDDPRFRALVTDDAA